MGRQDRRRRAEHVGHGQGRDPTAWHCHSTGALSQKRRCRDGDLIQIGQSLLSNKCGRRHQALTLRWWTKTSSEFVVGRHGATGNTSKLVATDRQHQRGPLMAADGSPENPLAPTFLRGPGSIGPVGRSICLCSSVVVHFGVWRRAEHLGVCKKPSPMQTVHNAGQCSLPAPTMTRPCGPLGVASQELAQPGA